MALAAFGLFMFVLSRRIDICSIIYILSLMLCFHVSCTYSVYSNPSSFSFRCSSSEQPINS